MRHLPKIDIISNNKILSVLLGIFLLLLLIAIYPAIELKITKKNISESTPKNVSSGVFSKFNRDNLDEIVIKSPQESFTMKKSAVGWVIEDMTIDQNKLNRLFSSLESLSFGDLLSKNPRNHMELGVSDALGTFLTLRSGSDSITLVVGIPSAVGGSFYARLEGSEDVYLITNPLRNIIILSKADWTSPEEALP